ncbi:LiaF transmembrane domain-containing protein [Alkaliphilus transvaalensis]|uniref:LiaF transmembrane domain-containing protein n=1 Tax=Alkaliphilus transvaalensis TaxID=114628 RepID=UPI00047D7819|nr:hypothetical protein [Alkaliphilus transvaalensis]
MGKWRVGTLTMGVALILLGVILFVSLLGGYEIMDKLLTWWPVILIMIGAEILFYIYRGKEEQVKIRYDVFSIFMIMCIFITSGILYGVTSSGIIQHVAVAVNSRDYTVSIPQEEIVVGNHIRKVVITSPNSSILELNKTEGANIIYKGTSDVFAESMDGAREIISKEEVYINEIENTLYIQLPSFERRYDIKTGVNNISFNLYLPGEIDVEVRGGNHYLSKVMIDGEAVRGNWLINNSFNVQVNGNSNSNFLLEAITEYEPNLRGNVEWDINQQEDGYAVGKVVLGNGDHKLHIVKSNVEVLKLN